MKHLIICNPNAGKHDQLKEKIDEAFKGLDYEIYLTKAPRDAVTFLKEYFKKEKELTRVYACGGDGTLHEVINGVVGFKNAEVALFASGSGNDFAKIYGGKDKFIDFKKLIAGKASPIDITKVSGPSLSEDWYSINVVNFGFDAIVGAKGNENKAKGIKDPYGFTHAIIPAILHGRKNKTSVIVNDEKINGDKLLLGSISQGRFVGGEYMASPKSDNADGLLDVIAIKPMSLFRLLLQFFDMYHDGKHLDSNKIAKFLSYKRSEEAKIIAPEDIDICVDGEMIRGKEFTAKCLKGAINFVIPE